MSHDKLKAAVRKRMAETGEPYAVARYKVMREHQSAAPENLSPDAQWFAISYSKAGIDKIPAWLDTVLFRTGPGVSGVEGAEPAGLAAAAEHPAAHRHRRQRGA
jgi:hypothetical protein